MKISFSFLSKHRTLLGVEIEKNGMVRKDSLGKPIFQNTIEVTIGIVFGYISIHFDMGSSIAIDDMLSKYSDIIDKK
jgi:hypothetical protein